MASALSNKHGRAGLGLRKAGREPRRGRQGDAEKRTTCSGVRRARAAGLAPGEVRALGLAGRPAGDLTEPRPPRPCRKDGRTRGMCPPGSRRRARSAPPAFLGAPERRPPSGLLLRGGQCRESRRGGVCGHAGSAGHPPGVWARAWRARGRSSGKVTILEPSPSPAAL